MGWLIKFLKGSSHKVSEGQYHWNETHADVNEPSCSENGNENRNIYQPIPVPWFRICAGCDTEIGSGRYLNCMGAFWHPECFRCHSCNVPIYDYEFSMSGNYPHHKFCYKEQYYPKCDVCRHFIPINADGLIEYKKHPFWDQKYCPIHELDGTPRCCSCELLEPRETIYVALDDVRKLCLECLDSAVMDTTECQPLYLEIQEFYEGLNMKVDQQVPFLLVERDTLYVPEIRGLCISEERTVSTILKPPTIAAGNKKMHIIAEPFKLTRRCEVTAILISYGFPRLLTGLVLAYEMMRAWLRLRGYQVLREDVEEGICQVLAHLWLESQILSISGSNIASTSSSVPVTRSSKQGMISSFERKLLDFFKNQIESDISPILGNGFRAGNQAVLKYGLRKTLDHIRMTGAFPL